MVFTWDVVKQMSWVALVLLEETNGLTRRIAPLLFFLRKINLI